MQDYTNAVEKAKQFISENIERVTPESVSSYCNYSSKQLSRIFEMTTGATLGEFLRWTRLSKALHEIKYSDKPILDIALEANYESQEAFTRVFKKTFNVTPGEYRKSDVSIQINGNAHLHNIVEEVSHQAAEQGLYTSQDVNIWHVVKPARIWISTIINHENKSPHAFYDFCDKNGYMAKVDALQNVIFGGGAYLIMAFPDKAYASLSFGAEVECDYPIDISEEFQVFHVPESKYIVFNALSCPADQHGSLIASAWGAFHNYDIKTHGLEDNDSAPVYEIMDDGFGYTLWRPVKDIGGEK